MKLINILFCHRFFKKHPDYLSQFHSFNHLSIEELPTSRKFKAHCVSIVTALSNIVDAMNEPELLVSHLELIGERHKQRGQKKQEFKVEFLYVII